MDLDRFLKDSKKKSEENKRFLKSISRWNPRIVDELFHRQHTEVFQRINCLDCANCCSTTSPAFYQPDIERASKALSVKPGHFIEKYLRIDEDGDYVLQSVPCPFLNSDHYCSIYDDRPKACREYPHTDRRKMVQIIDLTHKNSLVCPAVFEIVENIKKESV